MDQSISNPLAEGELQDVTVPGSPVPEPGSSPVLVGLAQELFAATASLHELGDEAGRVLEAAAAMYTEPIPHAHKKPRKAVLEFVHAHALSGLNYDEQYALAAILAVGRRLVRPKDIGRFDLSPFQQRQVLTLAALLRIAAALVPSQEQPGQSVTIDFKSPAEGTWLVLTGSESDKMSAALQQAVDIWESLGYPAFEILEPEEAALRNLPFPKTTKIIGLLPDDPLSEAARKVMRFHFARVLQKEAGTRLGEDIEALHDMRVATRRLRAAFEVFADAFEPGVLKPYLRGLRATGRALGKVRDLDVFMEKAEHYLAALLQASGSEQSAGNRPESASNIPPAIAEVFPETPVLPWPSEVQELPLGASGLLGTAEAFPVEDPPSPLAPLLNHWQAKREQARAEMLDFLDSREYARFKRQFNVFLNTPGAGARRYQDDQPYPVTVRHLAPVLIYSRLGAARAYAPYLKDAPIERLHALRIEFKKLRYTVEYFQEALGSWSAYVIDALKAVQDHLGDLNDADVASHLLADFIEQEDAAQTSLPASERENLAGVIAYLAYRHTERHHLVQSFDLTWRQHFANARFRRKLAGAVCVL